MEVLNSTTERQVLINVRVGANVQFFHFINAYGCFIDDDTRIGSFVEIQKGVSIGKKCKISSHTFICEGVQIHDGVFIGHNVSFINDKYPKALNKQGTLQTEEDWQMAGSIVEQGASIGTGATILGGLVIGRNAMVGAGSVVTQNVPPKAVVRGNPAKIIRYLADD